MGLCVRLVWTLAGCVVRYIRRHFFVQEGGLPGCLGEDHPCSSLEHARSRWTGLSHVFDKRCQHWTSNDTVWFLFAEIVLSEHLEEATFV